MLFRREWDLALSARRDALSYVTEDEQFVNISAMPQAGSARSESQPYCGLFVSTSQ